MSGPWEDYAKPEAGPWQDYAAPAAAPAKPAGPKLGFGASLAAGAMKPLDNLAMVADKGLRAVGVPMDSVNRSLGMPTAQEAYAANQDRRARSGTAGRIIGETAASLAIPAGRTVGGMAMANTATGALLSDSDTPFGVAKDAVTSGIVGTGAQGVLKAGGALIAPQLSKGVQALRDAGVPMTPGQIIGGTFKAAEDKLTSLPFLGDMIQGARDKGTTGFNAAVLNNVLKPIGEALPKSLKAGHDAIKYVGDKLSSEYEKLVPQLTAAVDNPFLTANGAALQKVQSIAPNKAEQFQSIVRDALESRAPGDVFQGQALKAAESKLSFAASQYSKAPDPDQQIMGQALGEVLDNFRDMIMRHNPAHAKRLAALNTGWASLVQVEKAGSMAGARDTGVFTPTVFSSAVARTDGSKRGRAVARGTARNQDLASAGGSILPSKVPDSGTAGRAALGWLGTVGGGAGLGVLANPYAALAAGAAALPYTSLGMEATRRLIAPRGAKVNMLGQGVSRLARPVGRASAAGVPLLLQRPE